MGQKRQRKNADLLSAFRDHTPGQHRPEPCSQQPATASGNHRSRVTMAGYHTGRKPGNAGKTWPAEVLTTSEMARLLAACGGGATGDRDRALYTLLWRTGLRISESLALEPKDIDIEQGQLQVLHGKNDKRRVVGFDPRTGAELTKWLKRRATLGLDDTGPVFCVVARPTRGKSLYSACVREQLRDCAKRAGITKRVHPHGLRHTFAAELTEENVPLNVISRLLGHSNSATTARYIDHIHPAQALKFARARTWADEEPTE